MEQFIRTLPLTFIPLFVAIDVFWVVPYFAGSTEGLEDRKALRLARMATLTALIVGIGFLVLGKLIFGALGITVNDFKIAGGVLLFVIAVQDLFRPGRAAAISDDYSAVVPIGVPLIVGPAVMTTMLILVEQHGAWPTLAAFIANLLICYMLLARARRLFSVMGREFMVALSKIMSILLASIAVMMVRLGIQGVMG